MIYSMYMYIVQYCMKVDKFLCFTFRVLQQPVLRTFVSKALAVYKPHHISSSTPISGGGQSILQQCHSLQIGCNTQPVRTRVRRHYRPNAYKRWTKHGKEKRLSNRKGLVMIWKRYLKGRHILWHWGTFIKQTEYYFVISKDLYSDWNCWLPLVPVPRWNIQYTNRIWFFKAKKLIKKSSNHLGAIFMGKLFRNINFLLQFKLYLTDMDESSVTEYGHQQWSDLWDYLI